MASTSYQHALNKRRQLVGQLVEHYVDTKPGEENYELATDFCLGHLAYHAFPDTYPPHVDTYYADLLHRMRQESQLSKAAALEALVQQLHRRLGSCAGHLSHTLLQLLAALAGRPVTTAFQETPELLQLLYQPLGASAAGGGASSSSRGAWKQLAGSRSPVKGEALTDGSQTWSDTSGDEYDPYGDSSELSDWGEGDVAGDQEGAAAAHADSSRSSSSSRAMVSATPSSSAVAAAAGSNRWGAPIANTLGAAAYGPGRHAPHYVPAPGLLPAPVALRSTDLLARLVAVRSRHVLQLHPDPAYCFPERFYVQQALQVLQGKPAPGFDWCVDSRRFVVDRRCSSPRLSMGVLHGVLEQVAAAGTCARLLQQLADCLATAPLFGEQQSNPSSSSSVRGSQVMSATEVTTTPCLRAFATALQQQLLLMGTQLADLKAELTAEAQATAAAAGTGMAAGRSSSSGLFPSPSSGTSSSSSSKVAAGSSSTKAPQSLVQLLRVTQGTRARVTLLQQVLPPLLQDMVASCPAAASTQLLDGLVELLEGGTGLSGAAGLGVQSCLLHLLLSSMVPLVDGLQRWLVGGREQEQLPLASAAALRASSSGAVAACCGHDFFIVQQGEVSVYDPRFWSHAYGFAPAPRVTAAGEENGSGLEQRLLPTCPAFLAPLAKEVLTAGKSLRLLRHMQQEECLAQYSYGNGSSSSSGSGSGSGEGGGAHESGGVGTGPRRRSSKALAGLAHPLPFTPLYTNTTSSSSSGGSSAGVAYSRSSSGRPGGAAVVSRAAGVRVSSSGLGASSTLLNAPAAAAVACSSGAGVGAVAGVGGSTDATGAATTSSSSRAPRQKWQVADRSSSDPGEVGKALSQELQLQLALAAAAATRQDGQQLQRVFLATAVAVLQQGGCHEAATAAAVGAGDGCSGSGAKPPAAAAAAGGGDDGRLAAAAALHQQQRQSAPVALEVKRRLQQQMVAAGVVGSHPCSSLPAPQEQAAAAVLGPEGEDGSSSKRWWEEDEEEEPSPLPPAGATEEELAAAEAVAEHSRATAAAGSMLAGLVNMQESLLLPPDAAQEQQRARLAAATHSSGYLQQLQGLVGGREGSGQQLEWLLHQPLGRWVPVQPLLQQALLTPIQHQVSSISRQLLGSLLGEWGLRQQLAALRNLYCLTSPTVVAWADVLLDRAAAAARSGGLMAVDLPEMEALLGDMILAAAGWEHLPDPALLSLSLQGSSASSTTTTTSSSRPGTAGGASASSGHMAAAGAGAGAAPSSKWAEAAAAVVADVAGLQVHHGSSWLLSLVLDQSHLQQLNKALGFLLQLRATRRALDAARLAAFKAALPPEEEEEEAAAEAAAAAGAAAGAHLRGSAGRLATPLLSPHQEGVLLWEMAQLMARLQEYVGTQLVTGAWRRLEQALATAATLDDVTAATSAWLEQVLRHCCAGSPRGPGATWRHIGKQLQQLMGAAAAAAALHEQLQAARRAAARGGGCGGSDSGSVASSRLTSLTSATRSSAAPHLAPGMAARLELRAALAAQAGVWREGAGYLMRLLANKALQLGGGGDVEGLLAALDMNGYYSRTSGA